MQKLMNRKEYTNLKNEKEFNSFITSIDWEDSFIKESYVYSPSYIEEESGGTVAADSKLTLNLLICVPENIKMGVELIFEDVDELCLAARIDISPVATYRLNEIEFKLNDDFGVPIRCKYLRYRIVDDFFCRENSLYLEKRP